MNVNGYMMRIARTAIVRESEKQSIQRSLGRLRLLLRKHFRQDLVEHLVFGSFSRQTILPRRLDEHSDVDFMIVFGNDGSRPQTYLDRLRRFVEANYSRSEIRQSHPTIQLNLNHITFELVPAIKGFWGGYQIPLKATYFADWTDTNPRGFNNDLMQANKDHGSLVKPLIRIMKYWNAVSGYPFDSYTLEQEIVSHVQDTWYLTGRPKDIKGYLRDFVGDGMGDFLSYWNAEWKHQAIARLENSLEDIREAERRLDNRHALQLLKELIPPTWPTAS